MRPILKWAGGKSRLAGQIADAFGTPCAGTYYEPFVGSAAVFLHLKAAGLIRHAVLSDANDKLAAVHRTVRDDVDGLLAAIRTLPTEDWRDRYYEVREAYNEGPFDGTLHAARFLWLNRAGYNGLYRENRKGEFNVPCGRYAALKLPDADHFREVSRLLQDTEIRGATFGEVLAAAGPGDQVYCDPPYVPLSETACFTGYCSLAFDLKEQKALALAARRAAFNGATVVLSNHDLPVVRNELYPSSSGFRHVARPRVARAISRGARGSVSEVIAAIGPMVESAA
ncbi:MAG: Dam family site-specific DNA-(adenine-N6)-methyltransferase [Myxococcota bacterium]